MLLRVAVTNKSAGKLKFRAKIEPEDYENCNVIFYESSFKDLFYRSGDVKTVMHLQKINQNKPWTPLKVSVEAVSKEVAPASSTVQNG